MVFYDAAMIVTVNSHDCRCNCWFMSKAACGKQNKHC